MVRTTSNARRFLPTPNNASALYLLALELMIFALWVPDLFYTSVTFKVVLAGQVAAALLTLAILVPFVAGAFDLSVGSMLAFSLVLLTVLQRDYNMNTVVAAAIALAACALCGAVSGVVSVYFNVSSFIATLGMGQVLTAATLYISGDSQIVGVFGPGFLDLGQGNWWGVPRPFFYLVFVAVLVWYVLEHTALGRKLFATGSSPDAARLSGIRVNRLTIGSLTASALIAGFAGIVYGAQVGDFSNSYGVPLLFPAFAALFFGSTQFKGRPNVWGSILAVYVLAFGVQGLQLTSSTSSYWLSPLFNGLALLIAVSFAGHRATARVRRRPATVDVDAEADSDEQVPTPFKDSQGVS